MAGKRPKGTNDAALRTVQPELAASLKDWWFGRAGRGGEHCPGNAAVVAGPDLVVSVVPEQL